MSTLPFADSLQRVDVFNPFTESELYADYKIQTDVVKHTDANSHKATLIPKIEVPGARKT